MSYIYFIFIIILTPCIVASFISYGITFILSKAFKFPMLLTKRPNGSRFEGQEVRKSLLIFKWIYYPIAIGLIWLFFRFSTGV